MGLVRLIFLVAAAGSCPTAVCAERWSRDVAVIDYFGKYTQKAPDRTGRTVVQACFDTVASLGLAPAWVDVDVFLPSRKAEREQFRRIVVPSHANWFSQTMYEGMDDYVRSGGLLITNSSLLLLDANDNYTVDEGDGLTEFAQKGVLGVHGHASCRMTRLRVLHECPLTRGLPEGMWLALAGQGTAGRKTSNVGAYVVVQSNRIVGDRESEQPFLTFRHSGSGACIYLVGSLSSEGGAQYRQLVSNLFSGQVLEWLCLQE